MKKKIGWMLFVIVTILSVVVLRIKYTIKEDTLYSQTVLKSDELFSKTKNQFITRVEALNIAYRIFEEGVGIDLTQSNLTMYINLYKDLEKNNTYKWVMSWSDTDGCKSYSCAIAAEDGKVLYLYANDNKKEEEGVTQEEFIDVVKPFLELVGTPWMDYNVELQGTVMVEDEFLKYKSCLFVNKENENDQFLIEIDSDTKTVKGYDTFQ